jgi:hypothetical protein
MDSIEEAEMRYIERVMSITKTARNLMKTEKPKNFPDWLKNDLMDDSKIEEDKCDN